MGSSRSLSRGRSLSRSHTPTSVKREASPDPPRSRSPRPRSRSERDSRTPQARETRNSHGKKENYRRSISRSRSPSRGPRRPYRERSYTRSPSRERNAQSSKIVVEKLTKNVTEGHLREIFGPYGRIDSIDLPMNKQFNTNRGTAYILYDHPSGSESAIAAMHEGQVDGAIIAVSIVLPRRAFSRSPLPARNARAPPPSRNGPPRGMNAGRFRSPPRRGGFGGPRREPDLYDARSRYSRSPGPGRRRRRSYSYSRSRSPSPPRRRGPPARSPPHRRRRSPSYSSYTSDSRSRSHSRSRNGSPPRSRHGGR